MIFEGCFSNSVGFLLQEPAVRWLKCVFLAFIFQLMLLFAALQKAGKHMEDSVVAAYLSLLLGCILQENMVMFNNDKDNYNKKKQRTEIG